MHDLAPSHAATIHPDSAPAPVATAVTTRTLTAAINGFTPVAIDLSAMVGDSVDVINDLTIGSLEKLVPGVPPAVQARAFELAALPDAGAGTLALPALEAKPGAGSIALVDDGGVVASPPAATGVRLTGGAWLQSIDPIATGLLLDGGYAVTLTIRVPTGASNNGRNWLSIGRRFDGNDYGITITELSSGALVAALVDPRQARLKVTSAPLPRNALVAMRFEWDPFNERAQWFMNGVASGAPTTVPWVPEILSGRVLVGNNLSANTTTSATGTIHAVGLEVGQIDLSDSWQPLGSVETLTRDEAASLRIATAEILSPVAAAGRVSARFGTASGEGGEDVTVAIGGYGPLFQSLTVYTAAEMPFTPVALGRMRYDRSALLLTPPSRGKIQTRTSSEFYSLGASVPLAPAGIPVRTTFLFQPQAGGTSSGSNPAGSTPRAYVDTVRLQQEGNGGPVTEVSLVDMNRAPKLNGGGEAWGHADDQWVPIHALWNDYSAALLFPTIKGETPVVVVDAVPGPGEGAIRILRTGPDLRVGDAVPFASVPRLGWWKPGVSAVSAGAKLRLRLSAPGSPVGTEDYALRITDAARPAAFARWEQATVNYADEYTRLRWANRGGDWAGTDGQWGAVPYASASGVSSARTVTLDVTQMVKAFGAEVFLMTTGAGGVTLAPPNYTPDPTREPVLTVTGGDRAGSYRAVRQGVLGSSDTTAWRVSYNSAFSLRGGSAMILGFDGAGTAAALAGASKIELTVVVTAVTSGGGPLQVFRPASLPPRPGPRVVASATPAAARSDLIFKVDTNAEWAALFNSGPPGFLTIANNCCYGTIPTGQNSGLGVTAGYFKPGGEGGYPVIRVGRMCGWHINYQPSDANRGDTPGLSGKFTGPFATLDEDLSATEAGRGGLAISGYSGYTCRSQRGAPSVQTHVSSSPLHPFMAIGDYDYYMSGNTNGESTYGINPVPRMRWLWIETVHAVNTTTPDGRWANDGVFELYVNGRKQCESRRLEYRVGGNKALWDAIWFTEYNGGTSANIVDRPWPFVQGPTYVMAGAEPIAPPAGWNVPFVDAAGRPDGVPLAYAPDF